MPESEWSRENLSYALIYFPWIGGLIGLITYGIFRLKEWCAVQGTGISDLTFLVFMVLVPVLITGGIHMDGFMDTQDALSSYQPKERRLEILKDSHAGAFAILTAVVYFLAYLGIYHELTLTGLPVVCIGFVLSRALAGFSIAAFPMAKNTGLAAAFSDGAQKTCVKAVSIFYAVVCTALMLWYNPVIGGCAVLGAALEYLYYYKMSMKEFGGITGDLAGFHTQICELVIAFSCVAGEMITRM